MLCTEQAERDTAALPAKPQRLHARLALEFERSAPEGNTILAASRQEPPLRVVRAFPLEDGAALVHLHNVSGGLLGGDALELSVRVGTNAQAQITTTGATRLYRPRPGAAAATQRNEITIGENALLEYVPDPLIPFAGARFAQRTNIHLQSGAGLFWWEIVAPGREASGEEFAYDRIEWATDVIVARKLVAVERARLEPRLFSLAHPGASAPIVTSLRSSSAARVWTRASGSRRRSGFERSRRRLIARAVRFGASAHWFRTACWFAASLHAESP